MKTLILTRNFVFTVGFVFWTLLVWSVSLSYGIEKEELWRFDSDRRFEVAVVYLNPLLKDPDNLLLFELNINSHNENLYNFYPSEHAYLQIGDGMLHRSIAWIDLLGDSHHINGILKFIGPIPESSNQIQLFLHDLGGVNKREFTWELPISRK